jgi:YHS domain-containing protein
LDLGAVTNAEIAVAVLADLVARRASGAFGAVVADTTRHEAIDPVCGMTVDIEKARYTSEYQGVPYWFCAAGCQRRFEEKPEAFAVNRLE